MRFTYLGVVAERKHHWQILELVLVNTWKEKPVFAIPGTGW
jgi:hypothetical protein